MFLLSEINAWRLQTSHTTTMSTPNFLSLPVELRELIYGFLFSSYTIRHGFKRPGSSRDAPWTEDANSDPLPSTRIALLLTSRQIYRESWRHLPRNVTLHFRGTEDLLHTLFSLDQSTITHLRHIRLRGYPFPLYSSGRADYYPTYYVANALSLFPGLCLDTLTVEDCWHGFGMGDGWRDLTTYFDIEALLKSDGWRELLYITPCTDFIASGYDGRRKRRVQPQTWDGMLKERDGGEGSGGAQVQMWIVPFNQQDGAVLAGPRPRPPPATTTTTTPPPILTTTPTNPTKIEDGRLMYPWTARPGHEIAENWRLGTPAQEIKGEVRILARRSKRARVVQLGLARRTATWEEMKARKGGFAPDDWSPYHNDMADAVGWIYGGWGRRMQLANAALSS